MKNKKSIIALSTISLTSLVLGVTIYTNSNSNVKFTKADDEIIVKLTSDMLAEITFEDYRHPKKTYTGNEADKKFTIDLGNGKYIKGVALYRGSAYQYLGNSLADSFGFNNTSGSKKAMNFTFLFSFENAIRCKVDYSGSGNVHESFWEGIKFGYIDGEDFYNNLGLYEYDELISLCGTYPEGPFPHDDDWGGNFIYADECAKEFVSERHYDIYPPTNVIGFQLVTDPAYDFSSGANVSFTIPAIEFWYSCL